jgi:hypothetical protein
MTKGASNMSRGKLILVVAMAIVAAAVLSSACGAVIAISGDGWDSTYTWSNTADGVYGADPDPGNWSNMGMASPGAWVIYDLGWPRDVRKMRISPPRYNGTTQDTFNPVTGTIEYGDEFLINWTTPIPCSWPKLESTGRVDFAECALHRDNHNLYQYVRLTLPDGGRIGEVWFSDSPELAVYEMNQNATYSEPAYSGWLTADGDSLTFGVITGDAGGQGEPYITYDSGLSQKISGFSMQARSTAGWSPDPITPHSGEVWVSDNPVLGFVKMGDWSCGVWGNGETKTFNLGNPMTARYIQLRNLENQQWAEFFLQNRPVTVDSSSGWSPGYYADKTVDGIWANKQPIDEANYPNMGMCDPNAWVIYDFGVPTAVSKVQITSPEYGGGYAQTYNATSGTFEFSNDKVTWTTPVAWSAPQIDGGAHYGDAAECAMDKEYKYRYARWTLTSGGRVGEIFFIGSQQLAVWEMNQEAYYSANYAMTNTVDHDPNTLAVITADQSGYGMPYVTYDMGTSQVVKGFTMQARARWADGNSITGGELWISDSPQSAYTKMGNFSAPTWTDGEAKTFDLGNPLTGRYLQLRNLTGGGQFAEFQVRTPRCRPATIPYGDAITVDGNLSDWAGATWTPLDNVYSGAPSDQPEAYYSAKWGSGNKIYVAAKVRDTGHFLTDTYTSWSARDALEIYLHTTGAGPADYSLTQADAQHYAIGITNSDPGAVWTAIGDGVTIPTAAGFAADGSVDGDWLYYEASMTAFQTFNLSGSGLVVSPLSAGQVVGLDVVTVGNAASAFTGMLSENLMTVKYANYNAFGQHALGAVVIGTLAGAKTAADGAPVSFTGTVTRVFGDCLYVEASDRSSGIRVDSTAASAGQIVSVSGVVGTLASGERKIVPDAVTPTGGTQTLLPLALNNKTLGGGNLGTLPNGQPGVSDGTGLNNIGLFVKTSGRCASLGGNLYSLNDGSGVNVTVQVLSGSVTGTPFISAQGIVSCTKDGSTVKRLLIVKDAATDIQVSP